MVDAFAAMARENLPEARLQDGSNVPAETPEELAQPIVPRRLEVQTVDRALLSAALEACGLDPTAISYIPYMQKLRASGRYSEKQLAYVGLLHGVSSGYLLKDIEGLDCNEEFVTDMERAAASDPVETP